MNADRRNLGLVGTTDGVPLFDDQKRSAWPFVMRVANLPDGLSTEMSNVHLHMLTACEFWELDPDANVLRRKIRQPKSMMPHLSIIVDDILGVYKHGVPCVDSSLPAGHAQRHFRCRANLLMWTGDYPGQAKVSGTHDKTCHWCVDKSQPAPEVSRRKWGGYRRYLPCGHPLRAPSGFFGEAETRDPPAFRTHATFVAQGLRNEEHEKQLRMPDARKRKIFHKDSPYKSTGVKEASPLRWIPWFDLVWDILPDMMHIMSGIWKRHILKMLKGERTPAKVLH